MKWSQRTLRWGGAAGIIFGVVLLVWVSKPKALPSWGPISWGDLAPAEDVPLRPWRWIVMHHTASERGSAESIHQTHLDRGWDGIGYHFVIGNGEPMPAGQIDMTFRWRLQREGAHARNKAYNERGIGICLVGHFEHSRPQQEQWDRAVVLAAALVQGLPGVEVEHIIGHGDVPNVNTACPGRFFDIAAFRAAVRHEISVKERD